MRQFNNSCQRFVCRQLELNIVSDSKKKPKIPPPDDFSKTTPNVNIEDDVSDWDKTNFDIPSQTPADDWGKTVINYDVSELDNNDDSDDDVSSDFGNTHYSNNSPKEPDWGMTQANVDIGNVFEEEDKKGGGRSDESDYGATMPYFKLPEAEREKYQDIPPTPTEKAQKEEQEQKEKGGVPMWFWVSAALMTMFTFAVFVLLGVYYIFLYEKGFTVIVKGAPLGSQFYVDGSPWSVSANDEHRLYNLAPGTRRITVTHPNFTCQPKDINGEESSTKTFIPVCKRSAPVKTEVKANCENTLDEKTREACSEDILDKLGNPPNLDDLLRALNLLRINFATGKANIPESNKRILRKAAGHIKNLPEQVVIEIGGHTDNVGTDENNQGLSERRATAVRKFLLSEGVKESRLTEKGYGEAQPEADNNTSEGRARNRRIAYKAVKR